MDKLPIPALYPTEQPAKPKPLPHPRGHNIDKAVERILRANATDRKGLTGDAVEAFVQEHKSAGMDVVARTMSQSFGKARGNEQSYDAAIDAVADWATKL